jgi:malonyl-CoA O-methyltransferase
MSQSISYSMSHFLTRLLRSTVRHGLHAARPVRRRILSPFRRFTTPANGAVQWLHAHELPTGGIRVHSAHPYAYQEVTGYIIPTLLEYGEEELAVRSLRWLVRVQRSDGAFTDPDRDTPYLFDTGQALRGLLAGMELVPEARHAAVKAADYLFGQMIAEGRGGFRLGYEDGEAGGIAEAIHLYVLPPLRQAAEQLGRPEYAEAARLCLECYIGSPGFLNPDELTHFLAYQLEALIDLGHANQARPILDTLRQMQTANGSVRAQGGASWVCTPGLAQLAICWYKIGQQDPADRAMEWLERHQEPSGGFLGSYGPGAGYFPEVEIGWAAKYYLDAARLRTRPVA